jgi:hypothetical protein
MIKSSIFEAMDITSLLSNLSAPDSVSLDSHDDSDLIQLSHVVIEWHLNKIINQFGMMTNTAVITIRKMKMKKFFFKSFNNAERNKNPITIFNF